MISGNKRSAYFKNYLLFHFISLFISVFTRILNFPPFFIMPFDTIIIFLPFIGKSLTELRSAEKKTIMSKFDKSGSQQTSLLDVLKKKMRQAREEAEQAKDEADEVKRQLEEERKKREDVRSFFYPNYTYVFFGGLLNFKWDSFAYKTYYLKNPFRNMSNPI